MSHHLWIDTPDGGRHFEVPKEVFDEFKRRSLGNGDIKQHKKNLQALYQFNDWLILNDICEEGELGLTKARMIIQKALDER